MRNPMRSLTILALVAMTCAAAAITPAAAGHGEQGDWEFGPYGGFGWLDDYDVLHPDNGSLYGGRVGYFFSPRWSLEGSFQQLSSEFGPDTTLGIPEEDFTLTSGRLNVLWNFLPGESFRPFLTAGLGHESIDIEDLGDSKDIGYNAGGGLRWYLTRSFGLRFDGRYVHTHVGGGIKETAGNVEATFGLLWSLGSGKAPDTDRDGVADGQDKCPATPVGAKVDRSGCPSDADGDGVYDGIDQCGDTPKGWQVDEKGCPKDTDGDGVKDGVDACPDSPKGAKVDARGCTTDEDGDGVFDGLDRCPATPRGAKVDAYGCPLDEDHDGVYDGLDRCPGTRHGMKVDADGCDAPDKAPQLFDEQKKTLVLEGVNFETNRADLTADSVQALERVAASLKDWPEVRVEIGGHTDSSGDSGHNLDLSRRRAETVMAYLVAKDIDASRMKAKGYGETKPITSNKTKEGRAKNRRVELTKLD